MKKYLFLIFMLASSFVYATEFAPQQKQIRDTYSVLAFAGFRTFRTKELSHNFTSQLVSDKAQASGVWTNSVKPWMSDRIDKTYYISHFHSLKDLDFLMTPQYCHAQHGFLIVANSWGANLANQFAYRYAKKCHKLVDLFILIDGIARPIPFSYTSNIWSYNCLNYYQTDGVIKGGRIDNCLNVKQQGGHIKVEWSASEKAVHKLLDYLQESLSTTFVADDFYIDYAQVFDSSWPHEADLCNPTDQILGNCSETESY